MPHYLVRFSYTPETWTGLIEQPENLAFARREPRLR